MSIGGNYEGPDRREGSTLDELSEVRLALRELSGEVTKLTGQLEKLGELESSQKHLAEEVGVQDEKNRKYRRRALLRGMAFALLVLVGFGVLIGLLINAITSGDSTSKQFRDFRRQTYQNCLVRNQQSSGQRVLIQTIETIIPPGQRTNSEVHALTQFLATIPATVVCVKP